MQEAVVTIAGRKVGAGHPPFVIAEMACAHNGEVDQARRLIDAAAQARANAVQLQFFRRDHCVTPLHETYAVLGRLEFTDMQWTGLVEHARTRGIPVLVCAYDAPSLELALSLNADGVKLNSADLANPEIVSAVSRSGLPFTLGTGASTLSEVRESLQLAHGSGARQVVLMHGVQNFPTMTADANLARVDLLKRSFPDVPVGYADHTDARDPFCQVVDLIALGFGASVIEKHITLDRSAEGVDYQAALEPSEFARFVERLEQANYCLGPPQEMPFTESDVRYRRFQKKSVVAAYDLQPGQIVSRQAVHFLRNRDPGLPPSAFDRLDGKRTRHAIHRHENIGLDDVD